MLDDLERASDTGGLWLPECYADLAQAFDRRGQHDDAIASMESAIERGWGGRPDPRWDIAEFHLRAGRRDEAARIWADLKTKDPDDVWLYIGRELDELERQADEFVAGWRDPRRDRSSWADVSHAADEWLAAPEVGDESRGGGEVAVAMAWFPAGEYEKAIARWPSLAEDWAEVPHPDYCRRMGGHIKWMRAHGVQIRAVAPIVVEEFVEWCADRGEDPEAARAGYAAECYRLGGGIDWPPGRNDPCWCGSGRKYKKCCGRPRRRRCTPALRPNSAPALGDRRPSRASPSPGSCGCR